MNTIELYQEPNSTFMNNGNIHDLNYIFKNTVNETIVYVELDKLKWQLEFMPKKLTNDDKNRINKVNLDIPGLLTHYNDDGKDKLLIVDGYHRLLKGIQENKKSLPYKFVSDKVMKDSIIGHYNTDKKLNMLIQNIKNPKDLLEWMEKNITYESKVKGYLRTPEQVIEDKKAHCWEATDLEHVVLNQLGYLIESLYIENTDCTVTHTAAIYSYNHEYYWFEWAWKKHAGIHKFKTYEDLVDKFRICFMEEYGNYSAFVKTRAFIISKDSNEYSVVEKLSKLTVSVDKNYRNLDYRVLRTSDLNIQFYKKHYSALSHVRTGKNLNGLLLINKTNNEFVAVLQTDSSTNYIVSLEVSPKYRNLGIGKKLLNKAIKEFNANKLSVNKNNANAINLYKSTGWIVTSETSSMLFMSYSPISLESFTENKPSYLKW